MSSRNAPHASRSSLADARPAERLGRMLASPIGVMIILPLLVVGAGAGVLVLGRKATTNATDGMARRQLAAQAQDVQRDVAFALDQAEPMLGSLRLIADPNMPMLEAAARIRDVVSGRPGVANVSIAFPSGVMRGSFIDPTSGAVRVQESIVGQGGTMRTNYGFASGIVELIDQEKTSYDPRTRPHYEAATKVKARVWMPPRTFFTSKKTGLTVTEPVYDVDGALRAVTTVDFDVSELSAFVSRPPFEGARTVMFAADGTILAFPSMQIPAVASQENRLLRHEDFGDPALTALFRTVGGHPSTELHFFTFDADDGAAYLASIAPVGGKRAGIAAPLDWYLATMVPERVLLGPTKKLEKQSLIASAGALTIALGVALMFAWNLLRMRKAVSTARERARSAEARARDLGSYRLVDRIGAGGMGEVWKAEHRLLARQAAIKIVRPEALSDPGYALKIRERFRREAQTLATMKSVHTIAIYDYGATDDGTFYYVMELLDGVDLDRIVRDNGAMPAARVIKLLIQACQSLAEAHDAGLLHRDVKPANLFVCKIADELDVLKVLDFGIVHAMNEPMAPAAQLPPGTPEVVSTTGRLTQVGAVVGTPGYLSPEQAFATNIDGRSDLYGLACVAWWLLTANEVFPRAADEGETIRQHVQDPIPSLRSRVKGWLPQGLEDVIVTCLSKKPSGRPANARDMIERLRSIHIPEEHAWTELRAAAWWHTYRPSRGAKADPDMPTQPIPVESSDAPTRAGKAPQVPARLIMPDFDDRRR
jgi:serine/threonine protein kinase